MSQTLPDLKNEVRAPKPARQALWRNALLFSLAFYACAELGRFLSVHGNSYVSFWLPAGLTVAVLLLNETRAWPWLLLAAFPANLAFDLLHGTGFVTLLFFYCANTVEALTGAWLVRRYVAARPTLASLGEFIGLIGYAAVFSTAVGAAIGAGTLVCSGFSNHFLQSWKIWWGSEALAIFLVVPFLLAWLPRPISLRQHLRHPKKLVEAGLLATGLTVSTWYLLIVDGGISAPYNSRLLPFLLWAGIRFGPRGAATANLLLAGLMSFLTTRQLNSLDPTSLAAGYSIFAMQTFLVVSAMVSLIPAIVLAERDRRAIQLRESEERFRQLTAAAFEAILITENGRIIDVNDQALKLFGYDRREIIGRDVLTLVSPESRPLAADAIGSDSETAYELALVNRDGARFHAEAQGKIVCLGNRKIRMAAVRDISARRQMEEALRASEARFRSAMQHSPIGLSLLTPEGHWLEVNPALCAIVGYSPAELLATDFQSITHPDDLTADLHCVQQMLAREIESYQMEKRYFHKHGHIVWAQLNVSLVWDASGQPRHFISQIQDISGRKRAEQALRENQAKLVLAMDMARLAQWEYDVTTDRFTFDNNFHKLYHTASADEASPSLSAEDYARKFIPADEGPILAAEIKKAVAATDPHFSRQFEHRFVRADGTAGFLLIRYAIVKDAAGRTVKTYGVNQDITDQKKAEQHRMELEGQLRQAQKMEAIGTLAGGIAHDFNNILGAITMFAELAKMDNPGNLNLQEQLKHMLKATTRATSLVQQILSFSRRQKQERKSLQLAPVIKEVLKLLRPSLPATIDIQTDMGSSLPNVLADPTQIHQIILNLCMNAAHALRGNHGQLFVNLDLFQVRDGSRPHIELRDGDYLRLTVRDTGHGMDPETLKRIFEPFFTTKGPGEGTGLGLAVVHGIVKDHEGVINVESLPGLGTSFTLYFPAIRASGGHDTTTFLTVPIGSGERILFVDDESALCEASRRILGRLGYQPIIFNSPVEAWNSIQKNPEAYDLVVSDLTMPGMTGLDLAKKILNLHPPTPVILMSGYRGTLTHEVIRELGIQELVDKPLDFQALGLAINRALHERNRLIPAQSRN